MSTYKKNKHTLGFVHKYTVGIFAAVTVFNDKPYKTDLQNLAFLQAGFY